MQIEMIKGWERLFRAVGVLDNGFICDKFEMIRPELARYKEIIAFRFGLDGNGMHTLEEAGKKFGVTRERIRQMEAKIIEEIRKMGREIGQ
jgi:hypothetical protein